MPYTGNPSTDPTDAVRLLIWDVSTSTSGEILSDGEVDWFISVTPNIYSAACLAAHTLGGRVTTLAASTSSVEQKQVGDLMLRYGVSGGNVEAFNRAYQSLCDRLSKQSALQSAPYAGGISRSDKKAVESNSDRVRPSIVRGEFDNPAAMQPTNPSSTQFMNETF